MTQDIHTPCLWVLWVWHLIRGPWRSNLPFRSTTLTPGGGGGGGRRFGSWLTDATSELMSVRDRTSFLSNSLDRLSRSTATVSTAESLVSISGAGLAVIDGWHLPDGKGAGALQCLVVWPGFWQRWQRSCPLLRHLLGHLSFLCRLSSTRARLFDIFSSFLQIWASSVSLVLHQALNRQWVSGSSACRSTPSARDDSMHLHTNNLHLWDSWTVVGSPPPGYKLGL